MAFPEAAVMPPGKWGFRCLGLTVAAAVFPLVGIVIARRASDPVHPAATGAALGAASGASAGVMVEMWCPVAAPIHVAIGHILPIVVLAVLGAALGGQMIAIRGRRKNG